MAFEWGETQQEVYDLIKDLGRPVTLKSFITAGADPAKPWESPPTSTQTCTSYGVFVDPNKSEDNLDFSEKLHYRSSIRRSTYNAYIPALKLTFVPKPGDKVFDGSEEFQVVTVSPVKPGTTALCYILQVEI